MLEIKPIQQKEAQQSACVRCGIPYDPDCMAYGAYVDDTFIGMSQFTIEDGRGYIKNLILCDGVDDFEAIFIMGRATLNFIDLCGVHTAVCAPDAGEGRILAAIGFKKQEDGTLLADMSRMFSGCEGNH